MSDILTAEDVAFLKELAHEILTQDTACTATPVYYSILEKSKDVGIDPNYADGMLLGCEDHEWTEDEVDEAIRAIIEWHFDGVEEDDGIIEQDIDPDEEDDDSDKKTDKEKVEELRACTTLEEVYSFCEENGIDDMHYTGYRDTETHKGMFLTKKALKKHVELNHYHYKKPVSYCHHGWRNPELEKLLDIVKKFADKEVIENGKG